MLEFLGSGPIFNSMRSRVLGGFIYPKPFPWSSLVEGGMTQPLRFPTQQKAMKLINEMINFVLKTT